MEATRWRKILMVKLINKLSKDFPDIRFIRGTTFMWSPSKNAVYYQEQGISRSTGIWTLLHELGHALNKHKKYSYDIELIEMEAEAWQTAQNLSSKYNQQINYNHIQNCLDTYRDWVHLRSTCPMCDSVCAQNTKTEYSCHNCGHRWMVSSVKFCRPYRLSLNSTIE